MDPHLLHQPPGPAQQGDQAPHQLGEAFPDETSVIRLVGGALVEIADEEGVGRRYFSEESIDKLVDPQALLVAEPQPLRLAPFH